MSWIARDQRTRFQRWCTNILRVGPVPKHIGIIMDGNRRFSKANAIAVFESYNLGFVKMTECIRWCSEFGVIEMTFYAFSIENFKRSEEEKAFLFGLLKRKAEDMLEDETMAEYDRIGLCIRFVGDWTLISADLKSVMSEVMLRTMKNARHIINIAVAYTSRNEIVRASEALRQAVKVGDLKIDDISEELLTQALQILPSNPVDMILRTSGVKRLSDFLLWQSSESIICFIPETWPALTFWDFWHSMLEFQTNTMKLIKLQPIKVCSKVEPETKQRQESFMTNLQKAMRENLAIDNEFGDVDK